MPDHTGCQRQSNRVPTTGTLFAHQLHSQHRDALPSRGGSTVFAQRYSTQVVELQLMLLWRGNDVHSDRQLFQNDLTLGLGKLRPGDHKWSDLGFNAATIFQLTVKCKFCASTGAFPSPMRWVTQTFHPAAPAPACLSNVTAYYDSAVD